MHPSERLRGASSRRLEGKTIVLGVTGSIAAVRTVELARELLRHGARVVPVMSREAARIVHPNALEFATGEKPIIELTGAVEHVALLGVGAKGADMMLVAPCTGNTLSKIALGIDDSPVTTFVSTGLTSKPLLLAPAMHETMYDNPFLLENIERLRKAGVRFVDPVMDEGKAKLAEPETIVEHVFRALGPRTLDGKRVLVINGATREPIDAMRVVTNRSTGAMGMALASEAFRMGADVEMWHAHGEVPLLPHVATRRFSTIHDLLALVPEARGFDAVLVPAALSDFGPDKAEGKLPSTEGAYDLRLQPMPKVIDALRGAFDGALVPFKAESAIPQDKLVERARATGDRVQAAFVVANLLEDVDARTTRTLLVDATSATPAEGGKDSVARAVLDRLAKELSS